MLDHVNRRVWLHFIPTTLCGEENHFTNAEGGNRTRQPAQRASALSITTLPLGNRISIKFSTYGSAWAKADHNRSILFLILKKYVQRLKEIIR